MGIRFAKSTLLRPRRQNLHSALSTLNDRAHLVGCATIAKTAVIGKQDRSHITKCASGLHITSGCSLAGGRVLAWHTPDRVRADPEIPRHGCVSLRSSPRLGMTRGLVQGEHRFSMPSLELGDTCPVRAMPVIAHRHRKC